MKAMRSNFSLDFKMQEWKRAAGQTIRKVVVLNLQAYVTQALHFCRNLLRIILLLVLHIDHLFLNSEI